MIKGSIIIISGPSGSGKGTVVRSLAGERGADADDSEGNDFAVSVSVTTRRMRAGEQEGVSYFFKTEEEFASLRDTGQLLEHISFTGNFYGTPLSYVQKQIAAGKTVLLEIDVYGALQVKERFPECVLIFLLPPTFDELKRRLVERGTEDMEKIERRIMRAAEEIKLIERYDYLVINDEVSLAVNRIRHIAHAESLKPSRRSDIKELINKYGQ